MLEYKNIFNEMLYYRTRLILTIIAIAWGTLSITLMLSIGEGLRLNFAKDTHATAAGLLYVFPGRTATAYLGRSKGRLIQFWPHDIQALAHSIPFVRSVVGVNQPQLPLTYHNHHAYSSLLAVQPSYAQLAYLQAIPPGRFINQFDEDSASKVVVLGDQVAKQLFLNQDPLNQKVKIGGKYFTVIGVIKPKAQIMVYLGRNAYSAWIPASTYKMISHDYSYSAMIVVPQSQQHHAAIKQDVHQALVGLKSVSPNDKQFSQIYDSLKQGSAINTVFKGMQIFLGLVGAMTLLVAGIGIANVMFASVRRATYMIGVKMALGARRSQILGHYTLESLLVTFIGGFIGMLLSVLIIQGIKLIPIHAAIFTQIGRPNPVLSWTVIMIVVGVLGLIGLVAGLLPAKKAADINPVEALRYE